MTLQQLKYIVAVEKYGSFGKAAEACGLTQPTLSLMVKKLEEELDIRIFDRDAHPVAPTGIGQKVIDKAKVVLYNAGQIAELTKTEKELLSGPLRIGLISTVSPVLIPGLYRYFFGNYPSISLQIEEMLTETVKDKLRKAEIDMGIVPGPVDDPEFLEIPLYSERFLAYLSKDHPLFAKETLTRDEVFSEPIWIIKDGFRKMRPGEFDSEEDKSYDHFFEGGRVGLIIQVVNDNGGLTVVPETHRNFIVGPWRECLRPIVGPKIKRMVSLLVRRDYIRESLLNVVVDAVRTIIPAEMLESIARRDHLVI